MSWEATAYVKGLRCCADGAPLSKGQKLLLMVLADYHNPAWHAAWPAVPRLAEEALSSLAQVGRDLAYVELHGVIKRVRPERQGRGQTTTYQFLALDVGKGAHGEHLSRSQERCSEGAHGASERCSEGTHGEQRNKEELGTIKNEEQAPGAAASEFNAAEMARICCERLDFLGGSNMRLMAGVIANVQAKRGITAEQAGRFIEQQWTEYRARFPAKKLAFFLSDGEYLRSSEEWRNAENAKRRGNGLDCNRDLTRYRTGLSEDAIVFDGTDEE